MPKMKPSERRALPASAFAYVDSQGERRLPIHDEKHVRNALARFGRVQFESEAARERARRRVLTAAKRNGIMPLGFITNEIGSQRIPTTRLPSGAVTFLLTDIEASTDLVQRLGPIYAELIDQVRAVHRDAVRSGGGHEVDARADEYFGVFESPVAALHSALAIRGALAEREWHGGSRVLVRMGIHTGRPTLASVGYVGIDVHVAARVSAAAHGGQILVSADAHDAILLAGGAGVALRGLGAYRLRGLRSPQMLFHVDEAAAAATFPPPRGAKPWGRSPRRSPATEAD